MNLAKLSEMIYDLEGAYEFCGQEELKLAEIDFCKELIEMAEKRLKELK